MNVRIAACLALSMLTGLATAASAQRPQDVNAALRYWMAFAQMEDPRADDGTAKLLAEVEGGRAPWDEARLGAVVRANATALATMQRATALPRCDWGIEVELGPSAPVAHLARARVLARLNTLSGVRLAALGRFEEAVETWVAGVRFSRHMAEGGSLIAVLSGRAALRSAVQALTLAAEKGQLSASQQARIRSVIAAGPETGFDWHEALAAEQRALDVWVARLVRAPEFARAYQEVTGAPPPAGISVPPESAVSAFQRFMRAAADAFRLTPERTRAALPALDESMKELHPFYQSFIPSLARVNEARVEVKAERERLLALVSRANE